MADVWQFSASSLELLESCLSAAKNSNQPNKRFLKLFKPDAFAETPEKDVKHECSDASTILLELDPDLVNTQEIISEMVDAEFTKQNEEEANRISSVLEVIPSDKLDYLLNHCNNDTLPIVAEKLSTANLEIICTDFFNRQNTDVTFAHNFVTQVFGAYLKRKSATVLDLLFKAHATYPEPFRILISNLLTDTESSDKILEQFFVSVKTTNFSDFLHQVAMQNVSKDAFIHHLNTYSCLYKNSQKTFEIQEFVLHQLVDCAEDCSDDKVYGKLLLTFFQGLKDSDYPVNKPLLERLINNHRTMFKRLCLNIFNNL